MSDIDGYNITSLILCYFFIFMKPLIENGYLYKAMPPLYLMDLRSLRKYYSDREWLYDKTEYYKMMNTIINNNCDFALEIPSDGKRNSRKPQVKELTKSEAMEWLTMNSEYKLELDNLGKKTSCDPLIVEQICRLKRMYKSPGDFKLAVEKVFPEMNYDAKNYSLAGPVNGKMATIIIDKLFDRSAKRFMEELDKNPYFYVWYRNSKSNSDKYVRATVGEFLTTMENTFNVKIEQRFKGLNLPSSPFKTP